MRDYLHEIFPNKLGYGVVYDTVKKTDAYQMNLLKCPKPEKWQDCILWSLCFRLDIENTIRKNKTCSVISGNDAKRRKATQVC